MSVLGTHGSPGFRARTPYTGRSEIHLPEHPTVLQVKHELSHILDCKALGVERYSQLTRFKKEQKVLNRLKKNRISEDLNESEVIFSEKYVASLTPGNTLRNTHGARHDD